MSSPTSLPSPFNSPIPIGVPGVRGSIGPPLTNSATSNGRTYTIMDENTASLEHNGKTFRLSGEKIRQVNQLAKGSFNEDEFKKVLESLGKLIDAVGVGQPGVHSAKIFKDNNGWKSLVKSDTGIETPKTLSSAATQSLKSLEALTRRVDTIGKRLLASPPPSPSSDLQINLMRSTPTLARIKPNPVSYNYPDFSSMFDALENDQELVIRDSSPTPSVPNQPTIDMSKSDSVIKGKKDEISETALRREASPVELMIAPEIDPANHIPYPPGDGPIKETHPNQLVANANQLQVQGAGGAKGLLLRSLLAVGVGLFFPIVGIGILGASIMAYVFDKIDERNERNTLKKLNKE